MDRSQLRLAAMAALAGLAWGYLRHRHDRRVLLFAALQSLEWFAAYGGASALLEFTRRRLEDDEEPEVELERITHIREFMDGRTGTEG